MYVARAQRVSTQRFVEIKHAMVYGGSGCVSAVRLTIKSSGSVDGGSGQQRYVRSTE